MSEKRRAILAALDAAGISYELVDHPAVYTIEEMDALHLPHAGAVLKNLFLRDAKGRRFHPNENTASVFLDPAGLVKLIRDHGSSFGWVDLS